MSQLRRATERWHAFLNKRALDADLDAEMEAHLRMAIEENMDRGMPSEEARRQALVRFGGLTQAKEHHRETRGLMGLDTLMSLDTSLQEIGKAQYVSTWAAIWDSRLWLC